jgi:hypothetical protein
MITLCTPSHRVNVMDIGHILIDGMALRRKRNWTAVLTLAA